jgi:hypothetical protein
MAPTCRLLFLLQVAVRKWKYMAEKNTFRMVTVAVWNKVKAQFTLQQATTAERESRGIALLCFIDLGTRRGEGSASRPGCFLPPEKTRYSLYRRLGGPQSQCGQVRKISPPPVFDPRTVQPVASRYTDCATRPTLFHYTYYTYYVYNSKIQSVLSSKHILSRLYKPVS